MKTWIKERGGVLTGITAALALVISIAALIVGISAGGDDRPDGFPALGSGDQSQLVPPGVDGSQMPDPGAFPGGVPGTSQGQSGGN